MAAARWTRYDGSFPANWVEAMKRRSRGVGKPAKARPRKALKLKGQNVSKPVRNRRSAADQPEPEVAQLKRELHEALEQQTATSEVLRVVSNSLGDLQPVFDAMLANATKICAAEFGVLWLSEGEQFRCVALHNAPSAFADQYKGEPVVHPARGTGLRQLLDTRKVTQVADMTTIQPYIERDPFVVKSVELGGYRSVVNVPMLKENELVGAISIYHREVRPFTERQAERKLPARRSDK